MPVNVPWHKYVHLDITHLSTDTINSIKN